jgi:23S rRNA pseudouridine2605 synthase
MFPIVPIVCYQSFMREHSGKERHRRGEALHSDSTRAQPKSRGGGARIAKVMARAGLCSRREAEAWIAQGRVARNGVPLTNPAINVRRDDKITVDGKPLAHHARTRLFLFHKPRGLVTTARDPRGRPTIFDYLRDHWPAGPRVISIGRLDINSEGLLLLTNDGGLARVLELPATGWVRRYRVRAKGETDQAILDRLRDGLTLDGVKYAGIVATLDRVQGANSWLTMALREGKNREIKRVLEHIGLQVNRLIRLSFGPFQLGQLAEGAVEEVRTRVLRDQLGPVLAKAAGANFSSPLHTENEATEVVDVLKAQQQQRGAGPGRNRADASHETQRPRAARPQGDHRQPEPRVALKVKPAPPARKHVSALRAEYDETPKERKRIERGETADRGGRTVYVERLVSVKCEERRGKRKPRDTPRKRRFEAGRRDRNDSSERLARHAGGPAASSKYEQEYGRRTGENMVSRAPRGRDQAQERSNHPRSPRPYEKPGRGRPEGDAKPPSGGGPKGRGGRPKGRPRGKS